MLTAQDIEKKLKEIRPYLRDKFQVNEIGYFGVDYQIIWRIATDYLPPDLEQINKILKIEKAV